jgi:hypothetical protein
LTESQANESRSNPQIANKKSRAGNSDYFLAGAEPSDQAAGMLVAGAIYGV